MKNNLIILFFFFSINSFGQCLNSENDFKEYFKKNISSLDPIEGIWSVNYTEKSYIMHEYRSRTEENIIQWAIIRDGEKYKVCGLNEEDKEENKEKIITFSKSAISSLYIYNKAIITKGQTIAIPGSNYIRRYTANATLTNGVLLEYNYDDSYEDIKEDMIEMMKVNEWKVSGGGTIDDVIKDWKVTNEFKWVKLFPNENDIKSFQKSSGSGFAISSNGIIATNYHVIDGAKSIKVRGIKSDFSKVYNAKVLMSDKYNDLALIQIDDYSFTSLSSIPYTLKTILSAVGENVFVLGYPLRATMGEEVKLTNGIISSKTGFQGDITSYQISAPVQPGNSGGPLFDSQGNLIGVINARHTGAENVTYAVKYNYLKNLIELLPNPPKLQTVNSLKGKSLTNQVELIKKFVYIIEVE